MFLNPNLLKVILISPIKLSDLYALQIQKRMEEMAGVGLDTTALDDEAFNMEATQDRCILRLIASCCNGELIKSIVTSQKGCKLFPTLELFLVKVFCLNEVKYILSRNACLWCLYQVISL